MTAEHDIGDLAFDDLDRAQERLYYAAKRYCLITERSMVQSASGICPEHDPEFVSTGAAAAELAAAAGLYGEAYDRWQACVPAPDDSSEDQR